MRIILLAALAAAPAGASAAVLQASPAGFTIEHRADIRATPAEVYAAIGRIDRWWDPAHTYGGKASALRLELRPGGCFCESLPGGGVEHLRVVHARPGATLLLTGALGPLAVDPVAATLRFAMSPVGGGATRLVMTYRVAGPVENGADKMALPVDGMLGQQFTRLTNLFAKR